MHLRCMGERASPQNAACGAIDAFALIESQVDIWQGPPSLGKLAEGWRLSNRLEITHRE